MFKKDTVNKLRLKLTTVFEMKRQEMFNYKHFSMYSLIYDK